MNTNRWWLIVIIFIAVLALIHSVAGHKTPAVDINLSLRYLQPIWELDGQWSHLLGTDHLGRDELELLLAGAETSLSIGIGSALLAIFFGASLGLLAGYIGGGVALAARFILAVHLALPTLVIMMLMVWLLGDSLLWVMLIISIVHMPWFLSVTQKLAPEVISQEFINAAICSQASIWRIFSKEILPNMAPILRSLFVLEVTAAVLTEATLSYLGVGLRGDAVSWGRMIADAQNVIIFRPWLTILPSLCLSTICAFMIFVARPKKSWLVGTI